MSVRLGHLYACRAVLFRRSFNEDGSEAKAGRSIRSLHRRMGQTPDPARRQNPGFNERAHGFRAFNELLLEAQKRGLLKLERDKQVGTYIVRAIE
jgi:hypothetical protein